MARIHRTLFPALTTTNQTQECPDSCDSSCPYNCYSFPDYYFPPPPPPISDADRSSPGNLQISSYLIILASLFTVIFVLVGFYVIKAKCYGDWCGRRDNGYGTSPSDSSDEEFLHENPIWLIATIGLQQSIINSITVCKYRKGEGLIEGTECSVCLSEFQEDETLRLLPKCNHAFHIPCIDTWLRSHTNCPLCRASIVSNNVSPEGAISNLASMEENANNAGRNQDTQMDRDDGEFVNNNMLVIASGVSENRDGTGEAGEAQELADESISKESANVDGNHVVQVLNDEIQLQEEIRSVSTDFRLNGSSCPGPGVGNSCTRKPESNLVDQIQDETEPHAVNLVKKDDDYSTLLKTVRRSSIAQCLHISPVSMKRSFSCSERIVSTRGYVQKSKSKSSILGISVNTRCTYSLP